MSQAAGAKGLLQLLDGKRLPVLWIFTPPSTGYREGKRLPRCTEMAPGLLALKEKDILLHNELPQPERGFLISRGLCSDPC